MNERNIPTLTTEIKKSIAKLESLIGRRMTESDMDSEILVMVVSECTRRMQVYASYNHPLLDIDPRCFK